MSAVMLSHQEARELQPVRELRLIDEIGFVLFWHDCSALLLKLRRPDDYMAGFLKHELPSTMRSPTYKKKKLLKSHSHVSTLKQI